MYYYLKAPTHEKQEETQTNVEERHRRSHHVSHKKKGPLGRANWHNSTENLENQAKGPHGSLTLKGGARKAYLGVGRTWMGYWHTQFW